MTHDAHEFRKLFRLFLVIAALIAPAVYAGWWLTHPSSETLQSSSKRIWSAAFSAKGDDIALGSESTIDIVALRNLRLIKRIEYGARSLAFSHDGQMLAFAARGSVSIWNIQNRTEIWSANEVIHMAGQQVPGTSGHLSDVDGYTCALSFSPDNSSLASAVRYDSADESRQAGAVKVRNAYTGALRWASDENVDVWAISFSPDGTLLAGAIGDRVKVWNAQNGNLIRTLPKEEDQISSVSFSPDGLLLAIGTASFVKLLDWQNGSVKQTFNAQISSSFPKAHALGDVLSLAFSPDGQMLAAASDVPVRRRDSAGLVSVWDLKTGVELRSLIVPSRPNWPFDDRVSAASGVYRIAFAPDGKALAGVSEDGTAKLWYFGHRPFRLLWKPETIDDWFLYFGAVVVGMLYLIFAVVVISGLNKNRHQFS